MRKLTVMLASLVLVLGLSFSAKADPTINLIWTSSALGATGLGSSAVTSVVGDTLTLDVFATVGTGGLSASGISFFYSGAKMSHVFSIPVFMWELPLPSGTPGGNSGTSLTQFPGSQFFSPGPANTTVLLGQMTFINVGAGAGTVVGGLFNPGVDQLCRNPVGFSPCVAYTNSTFNTAVMTKPVPEPGTAALLALGLGALTLAGRRRKA